ncbi:MAG: AAA family ATPase [Chloroflexota bacterium]
MDEPDQGLHPRALAALAGLFRKRQGRCQVLLATHSSYFLTCFDHSEIAVVTKRDGEARFRKISDSAALIANLEDFGAGELEIMHRNDELEALVG